MLNRLCKDLRYDLQEHPDRNNRILYYFAFLLAFVAWIFWFIDIKVTVLLAVIHYALSWIGHFYYEGNKPAAFRYPHNCKYSLVELI